MPANQILDLDRYPVDQPDTMAGRSHNTHFDPRFRDWLPATQRSAVSPLVRFLAEATGWAQIAGMDARAVKGGVPSDNGCN